MFNTEEEIIEGCLKQKSRAQKILYEKYYRKMLGLCLRYCSDKTEAEDVILKGFMQIFTKIDTYSGKGSFEGWVKRIMVNTAIDNYRKNKKLPQIRDVNDLENELIRETNFPEKISADEIMNMIQLLPPGYRVVFNLFAIEGYEHKEIAEMLEISVNTSKTQLFKARKLMQSYIHNFNKEFLQNKNE